jgi:hypothetical protein
MLSLWWYRLIRVNSVVTTLRRTMNCPSAKVTGSLKLKLSRRTGGLVATSMVMLGYSRVRVFAATLDGIVGRDVANSKFFSDLC